MESLFGGSITTIITVIVALIVVAKLRGGANSVGATLVLRKFQHTDRPTDGFYVEIVGRAEGIMGWLLTTIGLDATTTFRVTQADVSIEASGLAGRTRSVMPFASVASAHCGYSKSPMALYIGIAAALYGLYEGAIEKASTAFFLSLIVGGIFLAVYWFSNRVFLSVETFGGANRGLTFKRSVIEGVAVDFDKAAEVIRLIEALIIAAHNKKTPTVSSSGAAAVPPSATPARAAPAPAPQELRCPKCRAPTQPGSMFCESCGERVPS